MPSLDQLGATGCSDGRRLGGLVVEFGEGRDGPVRALADEGDTAGWPPAEPSVRASVPRFMRLLASRDHLRGRAVVTLEPDHGRGSG